MTRKSVVKNRGAGSDLRAGPVPLNEGGFERFISEIAVEIAVPPPAETRPLHDDLDFGRGRDRMPLVTTLAVEIEYAASQRSRPHTDDAFEARRPRHGDLVHMDDETIAVPVESARTDLQGARIASEILTRTLGQSPVLGRTSVQRDIERAVIMRIAAAEAPGESVVGRENAADEGDDGQRMIAVVAYAIDIPPGIAAFRYGLAEVRSSRMVAAARRPDSAAMGTPGPGCALPPAR